MRNLIRRIAWAGCALLAVLVFAGAAQDGPGPGRMLGVDLGWEELKIDAQVKSVTFDEPAPDAPAPEGPQVKAAPGGPEMARSLQTVALFGVVSLAPVAVLMATAFIRIQIVLLLVRQGIGSPQVPGNQVMGALAVLLTALVMAPVAETVYQGAIKPYADGEMAAADAWREGSAPIKLFMVNQIFHAGHQHYLVELSRYAGPDSPGASGPGTDPMDLPLRVVAPAFLISELTTAFWIGFLIYLPFLVVDLVVSAVLAASGLVMLPPGQVAVPLKIVLFVLADGWWLLADGLLKTFEIGASSG